MKIINTVGTAEFRPRPMFLSREEWVESEALLKRMTKLLTVDKPEWQELFHGEGNGDIGTYEIRGVVKATGGREMLRLFVEEMERIANAPQSS